MMGAGRLLMSLSHQQDNDITGDITGDSRRADARGWIDLQHCDWIVRHPLEARRRPGGHAPLRIVKWTDRSTPQLLQALQQGWSMTARLRFDAASMHPATAQVLWRLENARLLDYVLTSGQRQHHADLRELWTLACDSVHLEHRVADGRVMTGEWRTPEGTRSADSLASSTVSADVDLGDAARLWALMQQPERAGPGWIEASPSWPGWSAGTLTGTLTGPLAGPMSGWFVDGEPRP